MTTAAAAAVFARPVPLGLAAGAVLGAAYTLSPLTVLFTAGLGVACYAAARGLSLRERQWLFAVLAVATLVRFGAVAVLFLTADGAQPYASFFGDDEFFKRRTIWMRNIGLGVPISPADFIYSYEEVGDTRYIHIMALVQALVGESPYGMHVMNIAFYVTAALVLYRLVRPAYGSLVAMGGFVTLLFLPSLFAWSISALKEPLYTFVSVVELWCAVQIVRAPTWRRRALAIAGVVLGALVLQSLRKGGLILVGGAVTAGLVAAFVVARPRWLMASIVLGPVLAGATLAVPAVHDRVLQRLREGALYHTGHIMTPGQTYELLPEHYYADRLSTLTMEANELVVFTTKAVVGYLTVPLPWTIGSRAMLAYLPEQMFWYLLVVFAPLGVLAGLRRDVVLTMLLTSHALLAALMVALTSGNVGTLIRHRGLALPYLIWLSGLGCYEFLRRMRASAEGGEGTLHGAR